MKRIKLLLMTLLFSVILVHAYSHTVNIQVTVDGPSLTTPDEFNVLENLLAENEYFLSDDLHMPLQATVPVRTQRVIEKEQPVHIPTPVVEKTAEKKPEPATYSHDNELDDFGEDLLEELAQLTPEQEEQATQAFAALVESLSLLEQE